MESKRNIRDMLVDRNISKGQVKHLLTRNTSNKLELDKMTRYIDKKRTEKESQFQHSQRLLLRRYGGLTSANPERLPGKVEGRFHNRDFEMRRRSSSFDPSKLSRPDGDDNTRLAATRRFQVNSYRSSVNPHRTFAANRDLTVAESKRVETCPRALSDLPPLVLPPVYGVQLEQRQEKEAHQGTTRRTDGVKEPPMISEKRVSDLAVGESWINDVKSEELISSYDESWPISAN